MQELAEDMVGTTSCICRVLGVSRSGYYAWKRCEDSLKSEADEELGRMIAEIFWTHRRRYGARRIARELQENGVRCDRKRVRKFMKKLGIQAIQPKSFKPRSTESRHRLGYNDNLLINIEIASVRRAWVGDITYIPCNEVRFCYLAVLMDLFSRRIVGWHLSIDMKEELTLNALQKSIRETQPPAGLLHHTDRGGQYAGKRYRQVLARAQMVQSMSRVANCYDNAFMESCFGTIKNELEMTEYKSVRQASSEVKEYITYYNFQRRHSALNYQTPAEFENNCNMSP